MKNLAGITNKDNVSEVIAFRDGAMQRNEALIQELKKVRTKTEYADRIEGTVKGKKPEKEL